MNKDAKKNIVVAVFAVESEGFQTFTELRQAVSGKDYFVSSAALVKKNAEVCNVLDAFDTGAHTANDALAGGLIGMMLGILAGPLGVLLGGSFGTLVGMDVDAVDTVHNVSMLDQIAGKLDDGMVAIIALADESSEDGLDAKLSAHNAVVARFDAEVVADEVDKAYEKQAESARLAKMEMQKKESEQAMADLADSFKKGIEQFKYDMAYTRGMIETLIAEGKAEDEKERIAAEKEFEENSELLRKGFTK